MRLLSTDIPGASLAPQCLPGVAQLNTESLTAQVAPHVLLYVSRRAAPACHRPSSPARPIGTCASCVAACLAVQLCKGASSQQKRHSARPVNSGGMARVTPPPSSATDHGHGHFQPHLTETQPNRRVLPASCRNRDLSPASRIVAGRRSGVPDTCCRHCCFRRSL